MKVKIELSKKNIIFALLPILLIIIAGVLYSNFTITGNYVVAHDTELESKFATLNSAKTNLCAGSDFINFKDDDDRLQGSCCSAMNLHRYAEQVDGLEKYSSIDKIPSDPYDIPVSLAKDLLEYQKNIKLTEEQQTIYDEATKLSHEGGPCCCKCWRWYAFEGLAKYLITEYNFDAEQIAEIWDLEDGCGGTGHIEGMHDSAT